MRSKASFTFTRCDRSRRTRQPLRCSMKRMAIEELAGKLDALIKTAPREKILLTLKGQPFALVSDATQYDWEDIGYMTDPAFWKMIAERRKEKGGMTLEQVRAKLDE